MEERYKSFCRKGWFQGQPIKGIEDIAWFLPDGAEMPDENWKIDFAKSLAVFLNGRGLRSRNDKGEPETVRYEAVNAMLLNEFLKEHRKAEKQEATISQLRSTLAQQQKDFQATVAQLTHRLDEQAAQIQKVSAQFAAANPSLGGLESIKSAPRVVTNR